MAYFLFTVVTSVSWTLYALVVAQSALALRTARYILLFATNTAGQLVVQGIFQIYTVSSTPPPHCRACSLTLSETHKSLLVSFLRTSFLSGRNWGL